MQKQKLALTGQATQEQIDNWKKENPSGIFGILSGNTSIAYFRKPKLADLNFATSQLDMDTALEYNRIVMRECFLGGAKEVIEDDDRYIAASRKFEKQIETEKAQLVEL